MSAHLSTHELRSAVKAVVEHWNATKAVQVPIAPLGISQAVDVLATWVQIPSQDWLATESVQLQGSTKATIPRCPCDGIFREIDSHNNSRTVRCDHCGQCSLVLQPKHNIAPRLIRLRQFDRLRGTGHDQRPLKHERMAMRLVISFMFGRRLTPAMKTDFGLSTKRHVDAVQAAIDNGVSFYDLDRVLGDGAAIADLVHVMTGGAFKEIEFATPYDVRSRWARQSKKRCHRRPGYER
jgi:hypothetical protein